MTQNRSAWKMLATFIGILVATVAGFSFSKPAEAKTIDQRLVAVREKLAQHSGNLEEQSPLLSDGDNSKIDENAVAQWVNWVNWPNWHNWNNWHNWHNWGNWGNWGNY